MMFADSNCSYTEEFDKETGEHFYVFVGNCVVTKKPYKVRIPGPELYAYRQGYKIQDAMPSLSADDREFLISGFSPEGWNIAMGHFQDKEEITKRCVENLLSAPNAVEDLERRLNESSQPWED